VRHTKEFLTVLKFTIYSLFNVATTTHRLRPLSGIFKTLGCMYVELIQGSLEWIMPWFLPLSLLLEELRVEGLSWAQPAQAKVWSDLCGDGTMRSATKQFLFVLPFFFPKTGFCYVAQASLDSWSSCISLLSEENIDAPPHSANISSFYAP
jgi:hypothetical protein